MKQMLYEKISKVLIFTSTHLQLYDKNLKCLAYQNSYMCDVTIELYSFRVS